MNASEEDRKATQRPLANVGRSAPIADQETDAKQAERKEELDEMLDEALQETFPASDPVSMVSRLKTGRRRPAKQDS
jgi:hypothetical protein